MIKIDVDSTEFPQGKPYNDSEIQKFLEKQFNKKCCYCEKSNIKGEVEHFRPQWAYSWLKNECENLLWACHEGNNLKGKKLRNITFSAHS